MSTFYVSYCSANSVKYKIQKPYAEARACAANPFIEGDLQELKIKIFLCLSALTCTLNYFTFLINIYSFLFNCDKVINNILHQLKYSRYK